MGLPALVIIVHGVRLQPRLRVRDHVTALSLSLSHPHQVITMTNACVWPLLNIMNYSKFMPSHLRQLFVNFENLIWLTFLTLYCNH